MPELPEVETIRRGLAAQVTGRMVTGVVVRRTDLRWPLPRNILEQRLPGATIEEVSRRGKYLLLNLSVGTVILHLGMSGMVRLLPRDHPLGGHDHMDWLLEGGLCLRLTDPRRFGAVLWGGLNPLEHPLLAHLGPEPLDEAFDGEVLYARAVGRHRPVKPWIMDSRVVAGVGNIYAVESLFQARIHPGFPVGRLGRESCQGLAQAIKDRLQAAIIQGGTTLRDFRRSDGRPGYFQQSLKMYGRERLPCPACQTPITSLRLGGRASPFCLVCQPEFF
ncbi:MAG: bifunctional DNA-formamidopyrimidine glycosylase/DNA-(apurinic or apyrimidinic site) lyase [Magnetococcales bacterium]|nr:bifunctional DNA-formamidopyrimidine glycosylase/DNA-(apurinic or apyrimidinic site) lyase [Magnetococcales bacterium]